MIMTAFTALSFVWASATFAGPPADPAFQRDTAYYLQLIDTSVNDAVRGRASQSMRMLSSTLVAFSSLNATKPAFLQALTLRLESETNPYRKAVLLTGISTVAEKDFNPTMRLAAMTGLESSSRDTRLGALLAFALQPSMPDRGFEVAEDFLLNPTDDSKKEPYRIYPVITALKSKPVPERLLTRLWTWATRPDEVPEWLRSYPQWADILSYAKPVPSAWLRAREAEVTANLNLLTLAPVATAFIGRTDLSPEFLDRLAKEFQANTPLAATLARFFTSLLQSTRPEDLAFLEAILRSPNAASLYEWYRVEPLPDPVLPVLERVYADLGSKSQNYNLNQQLAYLAA
jgi:hypothetical protein